MVWKQLTNRVLSVVPQALRIKHVELNRFQLRLSMLMQIVNDLNHAAEDEESPSRDLMSRGKRGEMVI
jgi:hypothetical protein